MGARLQSGVSSGLAGKKGDVQSQVETNAGPSLSSHPNKMAVDPASQFTTSPAAPLSGHSEVNPSGITGNSPVRSAGRSTGSVSSQEQLQDKGLTR